MPAAAQQECLGGRELRKFDQLNRISIPTKFRARYGNTVYLFKNFQSKDCIVVYSEEDYLKVYDGISKSYTGAALTMVQRLFLDNIDMATVDKAGRITLKPDFIEFADLGEEALVICHPDRLELWNQARWDAQFEQSIMPDLSAFNLSPRS
jgi:MraZ protein